MTEASSFQSANGLVPMLAAYRDRLAFAREAHQSGKKVVGYVGNTVPVELILAADCVPVRVAPVDGALSDSDRYVESIADRDVRRIFQLYCTGGLDMLDMLVIPRSSEAHHKLYLMLREAIRVGLTNAKPRLWLYEIVHTQRPSSRSYGVARSQEFWSVLAEISGQKMDLDALREAVTLKNQQRELLLQLHTKRWNGLVNGSDAVVATGALQFMELSAGTLALEAWIPQAEIRKTPAPLQILVRGVPLDHDQLHRNIESLGANVVAEDDDWGSRSGLCPIDPESSDLLAATFEHYWRDVPCIRRHPVSDEWFKEAANRPDIHAILFNLPEPEDVYGWSYPLDLAYCRTLGKPSILVRRGPENIDASRTEIADQMAMLDWARASKAEHHK